MIPDRVVHADADEPAEQQIVLQPLHQLPLRAERVERLQKHRPEKLLRRDRWPTDPRIQAKELALQDGQRLVHDHLNGAQRMIPPNPRDQVHKAEQITRPTVRPAHRKAPDSLPNE